MIYYKNNYGQSVNFTDWPYMISESDLFNYGWSYEGEMEISSFKKGITEKSMKISVAADNLTLYDNALNHLHEVMEKDVMNLTPGRLYVDEFYLSCYVISSEKADFFPGVPFLTNTFTVASDTGKWVREHTEVFKADTNIAYNGTSVQRNLDYAYDFNYDYANGSMGKGLVNDGFFDTNFEMIIYGGCSNPRVMIAGHIYEVECQLDTGEYLTVNSITKKIFKTKISGEKVNLFKNRNRESYIFKKIPPGNSSVAWNGMFGFDVTLFEERSEPKWT